MRWILYAVILIGSLAAIVVVVGFLLPANHTVARSVVIDRPAPEIWAVITDFENNPSWREDIKSVSRMADSGGRPVWREESKGGDVIPYETLESQPAKRLVRRIADPSLPFGGTWTIDLAPEGSGTRVSIREDGEVRNAIYRFVSKMIIGHTKFMDAYLTSLGKRFGQTVTPA